MPSFRTVLVAGARLCAGVTAALGLALGPAAAGKSDDTIRFAYDQALENIDVYYNNLTLGGIISPQVWDTLIYADPETGEYKGLLATAWRRIDDLTLEFDLRRDVKFHDGQDFTADDVVSTFNFVVGPESKVVTRQYVDWIGHAEKLDPYRVRIVTKKPTPAAIEYLTGRLPIYPHAYYAKAGPKGMNEKPVGSGPYRVVRHVPGKLIVLERNPAYFDGSPKSRGTIGKIEIRMIPDRQTQVAELLAGGLDLIMSVPKDQAEQLRAMPNVQVVSGESRRVAFLQMNTLPDTPAPVLQDLRVRQAINHAIDRAAMVKEIVGEHARVLNTVCHPAQFGCTDEGAPRYAYDPANAKRLLAEAGYPDGFDVDLLAYRERNQTEAMIGYLRAVGIRANLRFMQYAAAREQVRAHKAAMDHWTWGTVIRDISALTTVFFGSEADDVNRDPEVRALLEQGENSLDPHIRKTAYGTALRLIAERAYAVPLYTMPVYYAASPDLAFKAPPDEILRFWEMTWR